MAPLPDRIHHLDALRCFCMLFGLLVHGASLGHTPLFTVIAGTSDHFRMAAFFLVSGFFTTMVCGRSDITTFYTNRGRLILVPLISGLLLLNPITNWLIQLFHGGGIGFVDYFTGGWRQRSPGPHVWYLHLWFLIVLAVYALLTPLLIALADSSVAGRIAARVAALPRLVRMPVLALGVAFVVTLLRAVSDRLIGGMSVSNGFLIMATLNYLAYFAMGVIAYRRREIFEALHSLFWPGLLLFGTAYLLQPAFAADWPRAFERASYWMLRASFMFLIICGLLAIFRRLVTRGTPFLRRLTDGVYSFYIFHFLLIYIVANLVKPFTSDLYLTFAIVLAVGFPALFLLHERVIAPSPLLTLLFNGKVAKVPVPV